MKFDFFSLLLSHFLIFHEVMISANASIDLRSFIQKTNAGFPFLRRINMKNKNVCSLYRKSTLKTKIQFYSRVIFIQ